MERLRILVCVLTVLLFNSCTPVNSLTWDDTSCAVKTYGGTIVVAGEAIVAAPVVPVGFTAAGIAAGSLAAKAMAESAIANRGGVVAGGVIATLQSVGAAGIGLAGKAVIAGVAGGTYSYLAGGCANNDINCHKIQEK